MSSDQEIDDPELIALRNELLNGLSKKQHTKSSTKENSNESNQVNEYQNYDLNESSSKQYNTNKENNSPKVEEEDDDELERLRFEALNAKRAKISYQSQHNNYDNNLKKNNKPGRFRYDKESEEEEDDDDDDDLDYNSYLTNNPDIDENDNDTNEQASIEVKEDSIQTQNSKSDSSNQNSITNKTDKNNNQSSIYYNNNFINNKYLQSDKYDSSINQNHMEYVPTCDFNTFNKNNYNNNFHNNYQTYRFECSKLMSNDAYEPPSTTTDYDLRNFLKNKTSNPYIPEFVTPQQNILSENRYSPIKLNSSYGEKNLEDLDYSLPITQPINISNEIYLSKRNKNFQRNSSYNNNNNTNNNAKRPFINKKYTDSYTEDENYKRKNPKIKNNNHEHLDEISDRDSNSVEHYKDSEESSENTKQNDNIENNTSKSDNETDDDDEDDDLTYKKMRSVVAKAIISKDKPNYSSYKETLSSRNYSRYSPLRYSPSSSSSSYNFYRRKHSNSASSK